MKYSIEDFDFDLPKELIAQKPASPRNHARLLVYSRKSGEIIDDYFYNLEKYLNPNTTLVVNNSKVEKARLNFDGLEVFLLETINDKTSVCLVRPGKKFKQDSTVHLTDRISAKVLGINEDGHRTLEFNLPLDDRAFDQFRLTPLPPYIAQDEALADEYQTVYADPLGSKAAPTAGLHFTDAQLANIKESREVAEITLHVGLGTFAQVTEKNLETNTLHEERIVIDQKTSNKLNSASHVTAVGTTSARTLESLPHTIKAGSFDTDIFITPGYEFKRVDSLLTNFHLPKSSLLMMIAAFVGFDSMRMIYEHGVLFN